MLITIVVGLNRLSRCPWLLRRA